MAILYDARNYTNGRLRRADVTRAVAAIAGNEKIYTHLIRKVLQKKKFVDYYGGIIQFMFIFDFERPLFW